MRSYFKNTVIGRGIIFVFTSILSGLLGYLIVEIFRREDNKEFITILIFTVVICFVGAIGWVVFIKPKRSQLSVDAGKDIPHKSYVITGLSFLNHPPDPQEEETKGRPSNLRTILNLVEKHEPKLRRLYLIDSKLSGVQRSYEAFDDWYKANRNPANNPFSFETITVEDGNDMGEIRTKVKAFLIENELPLDDTILDITAGTAAMTVGMTVAATELGYSISYQATDYKGGNEFKGKTTWQFFDNQ